MVMVKFSEIAVRILNYARVARIASMAREDIYLLPLCPVFAGDAFFMATHARSREKTNWKSLLQPFSIAEAVARLCAAESQAFRVRLAQMVNEDYAKLRVCDQRAIAASCGYAGPDMRETTRTLHASCRHHRLGIGPLRPLPVPRERLRQDGQHPWGQEVCHGRPGREAFLRAWRGSRPAAMPGAR